MRALTIKIPEDILTATRMTPNEISAEFAIHLFENGKLSMGKAKKLAGMTLWEFQNLLASKKIPVHYDIAEYKEDIATLKRLKRIK